MSLKLFRSTGYSSFLVPGEARLAPHPGWLVLAVSAWIGTACNLALWGELGGGRGAASVLHAIAQGLFAAGASGALLSLLAWRRTLKPAATLLLLVAALAACGSWVQATPATSDIFAKGLGAFSFPSWAGLLRWQVPAMLVVLALAPAVWLWNTQLRRLPGPRQMAANVIGIAIALAVMAGSATLLSVLP